MKTAIVHEWFVNYMGSEKCIESFVNIWDESNIFSLIDFLEDDERQMILKGKRAQTSFIQNLPFAQKKYRNYLPLFPLAIEQLDVSGHDIIISSSHAVAKGIITNTNQMHVCYCHTPIRYAWDLYHQYIRESGLQKGLKGIISKIILHYLRIWDFTTSNRVDHFIANSNYVARRIKKIYGKEATVIYPPVDVDEFTCHEKKDDYFLAVARFVPYKKIDLIVQAFSMMPDKKLVVIGSGPDEEKIKKMASSNIEFLGYQSSEKLKEYMQKAKAFVFGAEEDFGITNVEAESCGTPVIAYGVGGALETVVDGVTGLHFGEQTPESLKETVIKFDKMQDQFDPVKISEHAKQFSRNNFEKQIKSFVEEKYQEFKNPVK